MKKIPQNKGLALVEIVIASSIMLMVVLATSLAYNAYLQYALLNHKSVQAGYLAEEGVEVVSFFRDQGFTSHIANLSPGTTYYFYFNSSLWLSTTTPQYIDGQFLRSFVVENVARDSSDDIAASGTNDPNTKKVTVSTAYLSGHATTTQTLSTYITNINNN